jgi:hypothetical protein
MKMLTRTKIAIAAAVLGTLVSATAFAGQEGQAHARPSFPMPAAQFKSMIDARMAKAQKHLEERVSKLPADEARVERARFDQKVKDVNAEVAKAIADGTVTKEEARAVRAVAPHGNRKACDHDKKA